MLKRLLIMLVLLALVLGGVFLIKFNKTRAMSAQMSEPQPPAVIAAADARTETWPNALRAVGSVAAFQGVTVSSEVSGIVRSIRFESGEHVAAGEVLAELDDAVDQAELKGLLAQVKLAELQVERTGKLSKDRLLAQSDADEARAKLDVAQAQVAAKRAMIDKKRIRAPFAGVLGIRQAELGEFLNPGAAIVSLETRAPVYVDFSLPERHAAKLAVGQRVLVRAGAFPGETFEGAVDAVSPGVDEASRSIRIRAKLPNPQDRLRPGMFAEVSLELPARPPVVAIPQTAISFNPYGDIVFVIEAGGDGKLTVQRRQVRTGEVHEGRVEIVDGLKAGERVVSAGHLKLRNGQSVTIDNSVVLGDGGSARP